MEENKRLRLQKKEEREAEKKRKAADKIYKKFLATQSQANDSDSDDTGDVELKYDDDSEVEVEQDDKCKRCHLGESESEGVWVQCILCDGWWHTRCTMDTIVMNMEPSELEKVDFFCRYPPCI